MTEPKDPAQDPLRPPKNEKEILISPEREPTDEELRELSELKHREMFIQAHVLNSEVTPTQQVFVAQYVYAIPGQWREYDAINTRVMGSSVEGEIWKVTFGIYLGDDQVDQMDEKIPLSAEKAIEDAKTRKARLEGIKQEPNPRPGAIEACDKAIAGIQERIETFERIGEGK